MRQNKPIRLKDLLTMANMRCLLALVIILCIGIALLQQDSKRSSEQYIHSIAASMDESLKLIDANIRSISRYLAVSEPLASLYRRPGDPPPETLEGVFDMTELTTSYSNIVQDMAVVSPDGSVRSFFSNIAGKYIDVIAREGEYDFSNVQLTGLEYYFFDEKVTEHDPMFVCLFPLLDIGVRASSVERVGTVALICKLASLESILQINLPYPCQTVLRDDRGRQIVACSTPNWNAHSSNIQTELPSSALPLTICVAISGHPHFPVSMSGLICISLLLLFILFTMIYLSSVLRRNLTAPVQRLVQSMPDVALENIQTPLPHQNVEELDFIVDGINLMLKRLDDASRNNLKMETQLLETQLRNQEAELYALQSQVKPHFLFNTLQCIRSLAVLRQAEDISTMCSALSAILRYSIREMQPVSVRDEMRIVQQYLKIIDIRYQNRFPHEIDVPEALMDCECPCMILQPLVENAVMHGLVKSTSGGSVVIRGRLADGILDFEIADNGAGIDAEKLKQLQEKLNLQLFAMLEAHDRYGKSFGLFNIHRRIQLQYGEKYGLRIACLDGWTRVRIRFPAQPLDQG